MQDREVRKEEARAFERRGGAGIVGGDEEHEVLETHGRFGRDVGVIALRRAADLVPARRTGDCRQSFHHAITYEDAGGAARWAR